MAWARETSSTRVLRPDETTEDGIDVDAALADGDADALPALLAGVEVARGAMLADPHYARIAAQQGVSTIVTAPVLPALLAILETAA